jgi:uncharacterized membrane protein
MSKGRLEAFSDGVIAIIITIMVLELVVPHHEGIANPAQLLPLLPIFLAYVLSFIFVGIYWNNHHHLLHSCNKINGKVLWANLHLLFWLSLVPFASAWMGENEFTTWPVAMYGAVLWMAGLAYYLLERALIAVPGQSGTLARAVGIDVKGLISLAGYTLAIVLAFVNPVFSLVLYAAIAIMWFIPDLRIERNMASE